MARKKKTSNNYFDHTVQDAIINWNSYTPNEKNRIFQITIYPAFSKLVENTFYLKKFTQFGYESFSDLKTECITFLYTKIDNYDYTRGFKAFSFFNQIIINWIWAKKREIATETYGKTDLIAVDNYKHVELALDNDVESSDLKTFLSLWCAWVDQHVDYFYKVKNKSVVPLSDVEKSIVLCLVDIFTSNMVEDYNKKVLYFSIREYVPDASTQDITNIIKLIKPMFYSMYEEFLNDGTQNWHRHLYYPEWYEPKLEEI